MEKNVEPLTDEQKAERALSALEGLADAWAAEVNLNAMIDNILTPMRLNRTAPDSVREEFTKRMKEQVDAIVRQAWIEGAFRRAESAEQENKRLREALEPFVTAFEKKRDIYASRYGSDQDVGYENFDRMPDDWSMNGTTFSMGTYRRARAALQPPAIEGCAKHDS